MPETLAEPVIFAAGTLIPISSPPLQDGALLVREGRIEAVGALADVGQENPDSEVRFFPNCTIIPGAVNAHAHLGFRREDAPEGGTFSEWLASLIERLPEKEAWTAEAARDCAKEAIEAGTTYMAESSPYGECLPQLAESGMAGTVYAEFFPHEIGTPEEDVEFLKSGTGGLADIFGANEWGGVGVSPVRYAQSIELLAPETIAAHLATGVSREDIAVLAQTGVAVALCPPSNHLLGG